MAFYEFFKDKTNVVNIFYSNKNILDLLYLTFLFILAKKKTFILHLSSIYLPISDKYFIGKIGRKIFINLLKKVDKKNTIIFEINDLIIEQAIDLEFEIPHYFKELENTIFTLRNAKYVLASYSMRDHVLSKYCINAESAFVCINGGYKLENTKKTISSEEKNLLDKILTIIVPDKINYVYAGTLNKGRQIETVIKIFEKNKNSNLILIGTNGKWLEGKRYLSNINYIGEWREKVAHYIVSKCDIGIIPYDETRFYYNIAFPTKLSFYITAGISFLSTRTEELRKIMHKYKKIGILESIDNWESVINNLGKEEVLLMNSEIKKIQSDFYWGNIINKTFSQIYSSMEKVTEPPAESEA